MEPEVVQFVDRWAEHTAGGGLEAFTVGLSYVLM